MRKTLSAFDYILVFCLYALVAKFILWLRVPLCCKGPGHCLCTFGLDECKSWEVLLL
jgi:hypothetical protein